MVRKHGTKTPLVDSSPDKKEEKDTRAKFITFLASSDLFPCTHQGWRLSHDGHPPGLRVTSNFLPDETDTPRLKPLFPPFTAFDTPDLKTLPLYNQHSITKIFNTAKLEEKFSTRQKLEEMVQQTPFARQRNSKYVFSLKIYICNITLSIHASSYLF